ncbi:MAG: hypothetical protein HYU36_17205 [Planctomycetes bacterium]|nr:hypothetical protein [Planctomycetota bacterium]
MKRILPSSLVIATFSWLAVPQEGRADLPRSNDDPLDIGAPVVPLGPTGCGEASLRVALWHLGLSAPSRDLAPAELHRSPRGLSLLELRGLANHLGLKAGSFHVNSVTELAANFPSYGRECLAVCHMLDKGKGHYVLVTACDGHVCKIFDPLVGYITIHGV